MAEDEEDILPAFSWPTNPEDQPKIVPILWEEITPEWAWGGATGKGITVCIVDSGVENDHPAVDGAVRGGIVVDQGGWGQYWR